MPVSFAIIAPHPPLLLPSVGKKEDREKVEKTIKSLQRAGKELQESRVEKILISSPHPDWGFDVPLYFLAQDFRGEIEKILTKTDSPKKHFQKGEEFYFSQIANLNRKIGIIASGDLSHCLDREGPYGFHSDGPSFDRELVTLLKEKNIPEIWNLESKYPDAGECGLRSICFLLGILEARQKDVGKGYEISNLSYEGPFGVGYLVTTFRL